MSYGIRIISKGAISNHRFSQSALYSYASFIVDSGETFLMRFVIRKPVIIEDSINCLRYRSFWIEQYRKDNYRVVPDKFDVRHNRKFWETAIGDLMVIFPQ